jgi:hypothetical protein
MIVVPLLPADAHHLVRRVMYDGSTRCWLVWRTGVLQF